MERVLASLRELVFALGLQERAVEIEEEARALLSAHDNAVADEATVGQRPENKALAICYIAANHILLPERVSYEAMARAAAATPTWRTEPVPGKNGMTKLVKRFARRICPIEHDPEIVEKANSSFTICTQCHYILRTGGSASRIPDEGSPDDDPHEVATTTPRRAGLQGLSTGKDLYFDEPADVRTTDPDSKTADEKVKEPEEAMIVEPATVEARVDEPETQADDADISEAEADVEVEETASGNAPAGLLSGITPDVRKKWLASAMVQAKKFVKQIPVLKPAVPGAMALVKRSIDSYITSEKVLGSLVQKVVKMALLHESKMQNLPVTTKDMNIPPSDYLKFLSVSSTTVAPPTATSDETLVNRALAIIAAHEHKPVDDETRERVSRFQAVTRRKIMGFSPAMAAAVIAYIDITRYDPAVVLSKIASISGTNTSSLYNATGRFLEKVGRPGDPSASLNERIVAAFPPRDK
jgi:hypothetical protein